MIVDIDFEDFPNFSDEEGSVVAFFDFQNNENNKNLFELLAKLQHLYTLVPILKIKTNIYNEYLHSKYIENSDDIIVIHSDKQINILSSPDQKIIQELLMKFYNERLLLTNNIKIDVNIEKDVTNRKKSNETYIKFKKHKYSPEFDKDFDVYLSCNPTCRDDIPTRAHPSERLRKSRSKNSSQVTNIKQFNNYQQPNTFYKTPIFLNPPMIQGNFNPYTYLHQSQIAVIPQNYIILNNPMSQRFPTLLTDKIINYVHNPPSFGNISHVQSSINIPRQEVRFINLCTQPKPLIGSNIFYHTGKSNNHQINENKNGLSQISSQPPMDLSKNSFTLKKNIESKPKSHINDKLLHSKTSNKKCHNKPKISLKKSKK